MQRYFAKNIEKEKVTLKESDIHHIKNVMRMNIHNKIEIVFNKKIYLCEILNNYQIKIIEEIISNEQNKKEIILASSLIKEQKQDLILQKTTELGVDTIIPLCLSRCVVKLDENKFAKKKIRWESICKEASEQSKRNDIPTIKNIHKIEDLVKIEADLKLVLDTKENFKTIKNVLHNHPTCDKIIIVIGPEGGITKEEITYLHKHGYQSISLGENILRSETAAIAALSMLNYHYLR